MSLISLLVAGIILFLFWWYAQKLDPPWPKVATGICVFVLLVLFLSMFYPLGGIRIGR